MKNIALLILFTGYSLLSHAQIPQDMIEFANSVDLSRGFSDNSYKNTYEGSPFLHDEWQKGIAYIANGEQQELIMRYLILEKCFIVQTGESVGKLAINRLSSVELGGRRFIWSAYKAGNNIQQDIFELLHAGSQGVDLLKHHSIEVRAGNDGSGYQQEQKPRLTKKTTLYYRTPDAPMQELPTKKKDFLDIFGDKSALVNSFFSAERLRMNEDGYIKAFEYYNSLTGEN